MKKKYLTVPLLLLAGLAVSGMAASAQDTVRVGGLKGPTSMGIASLGAESSEYEEHNSYEKVMVTAADELMAELLSKKVDIALIPANAASVLYNKTEGGIKVIDINTLGVLYVAETGDTIASVEDLKGKTVYLTGKGTTPDFVIQYLLAEHGLTTEDVKLEYKAEPTEVVSVLAEDENAVGLLPQPFVTVAQAQNEKIRIALDLTKEWDALQEEGGSALVTGVTVVRTEFLEENEEAVAGFLEDHEHSTAYTNEHPEEAAALIEELGIVAKAPIAQKAIPMCNITYIDGEEMQEKLGGYLEVLYEMEPKSVGGALPDENFYYIAKEE